MWKLPTSKATHRYSGTVQLYPSIKAVLRIRDPVPIWPLDQGSGLGFLRIPDLGTRSRIPNPYFWELSDNFPVKSTTVLSEFAQIFSLPVQNEIIFNLVIFVATKKVGQLIFYPCSFVAVGGSGIQDPGSKNRDPRWIKIRIRDKHPGSATL